MKVDSILKRFERFGVDLSLERIQILLETLGNPHQQLPVIHVAGSNGKGSVCAYLSSILTAAGYRVGRYISPHLVDWTERICLNEMPISSMELEQLLQEVEAAIKNPTPTQFEVITAAAWLYFAKQQVDVAVMEVGLGGRLDATNVCDSPLVAIVTSISREHWQRLGPTIAEIAGEKAGILKSGCPAVIGQLPPEAKAVVEKRIADLGCSAVWVEPASLVTPPAGESMGRAVYGGIEYPLPLLGEAQLQNSAIAIATVQILQENFDILDAHTPGSAFSGKKSPNYSISLPAIQQGMANTKWPGRLQWTTWRNHRLLIDGAHNPAAAKVLRQYVDSLNLKSVSWVMGMLSTKDHADIFQVLLRPGDRLYLVPVPEHSSAIPQELATLAQTICSKLEFCQAYPDLQTGLEAALMHPDNLIVLSGSLYLLGHFLASCRH